MTEAPRNCLPSGHDEKFDVFHDKATERKILSLAIKCPCEGCEWTGELRNKQVHLVTCSFEVVTCTNESCHVSLKRKDLEQHVTIMCEWRIIECEYCKDPHPECHTQDHVVNCNKFPVPCPNNCGDSVSREMVPDHIEEQCPLSLVSCPYAEMGCKEKIKRKNVEPHLESSMRHHIDSVCDQLKNTQNQLHETQKQLHETKSQLNDAQMMIKKLEEKVGTNKYIWRVNEYSKMLAEKVKTSYIFYTEFQYGYKLKLTFNAPLRGFFASDRHVIALAIMKGEYDGILPWPFNKTVKVTLIDQEEDPLKREHIVRCVNSGTNAYPLAKRVCSRPQSKENPEHNIMCIATKTLKERRYLVDDTLFFQVECL